MSNFSDRKILVTGAAGGIGYAIAAAFAQAGAAVIGLDHASREDTAIPLLRVDLREEAQVIEQVGRAAQQLSRIDVLVNCAGSDGEGPLATLEIADFDRILAVNVRGAVLVTREVLRHMTAGGRIINIASELAYTGRSHYGCYAASKGALLSLTRSWARELGPDILVNTVAPGPIDAPMLRWDSIPPEVQAEETRNPCGRVGRPEEVARAVLFLADPQTGFITGQCLNVDGGAAMH